MKKILKYSKNIDPTRITMQMIRDLLTASLSDFFEELARLSNIWDSTEQSKIVEKINNHNKKVSSGDLSYVFNEFKFIKLEEKLKEEKSRYVNSGLNIMGYESNKLSVIYQDNTYIEFDLLEDITSANDLHNLNFDLANIRSIKIEINTEIPLQTIKISFPKEYSFDSANYLISSADEKRYHFLKDKFGEIFEKYKIKEYVLLYNNTIQNVISVFLSIGFFLLFNQLIYNLRSLEFFSFINTLSAEKLFSVIFLPSVLFFFYIQKEFTKAFPQISYDDMFKKSNLKILLSVFVSPLIIDFIIQAIS